MLLGDVISHLEEEHDEVLLFTCDIERRGVTTLDPFGQDIPGPYAAHLTAEPCWLQQPSGASVSQPNVGQDRTVTIQMPMLRLSRGTDVRATDQVTAVYDEAGAVIITDVDILQVVAHPTHVLCLLREIV